MSTNSPSRNVGTGLSAHDLIGDLVISARSSACDSRRNVDSEHFTAPASGGGVGLSAVAARIASTLLVKNVAKSSAVKSFGAATSRFLPNIDDSDRQSGADERLCLPSQYSRCWCVSVDGPFGLYNNFL